MLKFNILISFSLLFCIFSYSQNTKSITILNRSDSTVVPFAQVFNKKTFQGTISDANGVFKLKLSDTNYELEIRHIDYKTVRLEYDNLTNLDTILLSLESTVLPMVTVNNIKSNVLYKSINKLLKSVRQNNYQTPINTYIYYLESELNNQNIEKIKSIISFKHSFNSGFILNDFYTEYGEFLFDSKAPFVNLQTNEWLLEFDPFSIKKKNSQSFFPTNSSKIKRKNFFLQKNHCEYCNENEISLSIFSRLDSSQMIIIYNEESNLVKEVNYTIIDSDRYSFLRINNEKISITNFNINYIFNEKNQNIELVNFSLILDLGKNNKLKIRGFLKKEKVLNSDLLVLGNFVPSSIYEQIILNPSNYQKELDSIFKNEYNGYDLSGKGYLSSSNDSIKSNILMLDGTNQIKMWKQKRLTILDYAFLYTENEFYVDSWGKVISYEDLIDVSWIFNFKKVNDEYVVESIPSIWNTNKSLIISKTKDTLFSAFKANIIYDLYEIKRLELYDIIKEKLKDNSSLSSIKKDMKLFFKQSRDEIKFISKSIYFNEVDSFMDLNSLNDYVYSKKKIDNLLEVYLTQLNIIIEFPTYYSILNKYIKLGYQLEHDPKLADYCFKKAILMSNTLISHYNESSGFKENQLGAYYSVLSELYHEIGEYEKECDCLMELKELWPEGFSFHKKQKFNIRCQ